MNPGRGGARLARVGLFSIVAVSLAVVAHHAGHGSVSPLLTLATLPIVMLLVNLLGGRRRRPVTLVLAMGGLQAGLHVTFMTAAAVAACHIAQPGSGHLHAAAPAAMTMQCAPGMAHPGAAPASRLLSVMTLGHALAAVLLVAVLARADTALWELARGLGFRALLVTWTPLVPAVPVVRRQWTVPARPRRSVFANVVLRRGPPALVCPL